MTRTYPLFIYSADSPTFYLDQTINAFCKSHNFDKYTTTKDLKTFNLNTLDDRTITTFQNQKDDSLFEYLAIVLIPSAKIIQDFSTKGLIFDTTYDDIAIDVMSQIHSKIDDLPNDIIFSVILPPELGMVPYEDSYIRTIVTKKLYNSVDNINHEQRKYFAHATIAAAIVDMQIEYHNAENELTDVFGDISFDKDLLNKYIKELCEEKEFTPSRKAKIDKLLNEIN